MTDGFVRLPADSVGKKLRTWVLPDSEHAEAVVLVDRDGNLLFSPESPKLSVLSYASLAEGASTDLDTATISPGTTGQLLAATISSAVALKCEIYAVDGLSEVLRDVVFTSEVTKTFPWRSPSKDWVTQDGGAGRLFRFRITNLGLSGPADVYVSGYYDEVS